MSAREKLQLSRLKPTQLELLGDDVDLSHLYLTLNHKGVDIINAVSDVTVDRTIEGASTVLVEVEDRDYALLNSGRLSSRNDISIDGLWFRLAQVTKSGTTLELAFEDREIAVLRTYNKPIKQGLKTSRARITRAQFVLRMIREVKEFKIPYVIPELKKTQPITDMKTVLSPVTKRQNRDFGIPKNNGLMVKSAHMDENQRNVANTILDVATSMVLARAYQVMAIMCAIQESTLANLRVGSPGDFNWLGSVWNSPVGVFQQIPRYWQSQGGASRDIAKDARAFLTALVKYSNDHKGGQYQNLIEGVQNSGNPQAYATWRVQAEQIVNAYGVTSAQARAANNQFAHDNANATYEFYRGLPPTTKTRKQKYGGKWGKEDSWTCIQRLASEVEWRAFFVSGTFFFLAEDDLFRSNPVAILDHDSPGVNSIDGDYDEGKKTATVTINAEISRWQAPPGSVIQLRNMGPWNGRWLVNDITRSLFKRTGTITLKKPMPRLPEPGGTNIINQGGGTTTTWSGTLLATDPVGTRQYHVGTALVQPVPAGHGNHIIQGVHDTAGLPGYPAADFGANAGAPVVAVESGKIVRLSGHDPKQGAWDAALGVHGPFGWNVYLLGDSGTEYFYTHLGTRRSDLLGQRVSAGELLATVGNYAAIGGANHVHLGVHPGPKGRPDIHDVMSAPLAQR